MGHARFTTELPGPRSNIDLRTRELTIGLPSYQELTVADARQIKKVEMLRKIRSTLSLFGEKCLKIKTKQAEVVPFKMNRAQKYAHRRLEDQLLTTGKVRALFLKGRQQGISTYVAARYYHKSSLWRAINVYILAHEQKATDNLF